MNPSTHDILEQARKQLRSSFSKVAFQPMPGPPQGGPPPGPGGPPPGPGGPPPGMDPSQMGGPPGMPPGPPPGMDPSQMGAPPPGGPPPGMDPSQGGAPAADPGPPADMMMQVMQMLEASTQALQRHDGEIKELKNQFTKVLHENAKNAGEISLLLKLLKQQPAMGPDMSAPSPDAPPPEMLAGGPPPGAM